MTAVLVVKRKNTDSPLDKLVIACKRARTGSPVFDESEHPIQTVVQFAGTVTDPTEDVAQHVAKVMPNMNTEIVRGVKRTCDSSHSANVSNKKLIAADPMVERYKVVNCQRSQDTLNEEKKEDRWLTRIDVEDSWSVSGTAKPNAKETEDIEDFVFDLYFGPTNDDVWFENNQISVQELEYQPYVEPEDTSETSSDDSNAESNWRNDYPDSDNSEDEDYNSDCSVGDNDEYIYGEPFEEEDKNIYGRSYQEYRRIIQAKLNDNSSSNASDDEGKSSNYSSDESMGIL